MGNNTDNIVYFGQDYDASPIEQKASLHISADGVLTIVRRWVGTSAGCAGQQSKIRDAIPAWTDTTGPNSQLDTFLDINALCIETDIDGIDGKADMYMLTEIYQGYVAAPFTIYSWQTSRLDLPIVQHLKFNTEGIMQAGVHWINPTSGQPWQGFTPFNVGGPDSGSLNPYVGIENFPVQTGIWKKTQFFCTNTSNQGGVGGTVPSIGSGGPITGNLWKKDAPSTGDYGNGGTLDIGLPDSDNSTCARGTDFCTWIKSEENLTNLYRGASELWQFDEAWWANPICGWRRDLYE